MNQEALEALVYFSDAGERPDSFVLLEGTGRVMLSAPHAVLQTREGRLKQAERYTGMLCLLLNRHAHIPCIYKTRNMGDDANYDPESPYRDALCDFVHTHGIRCVLDLHQLSPSRPMALCIGTGNGAHLNGLAGAVGCVSRAFERRGLAPVTLDDPFSASMPYTVSAAVARTGTPALQLELNSALLMEDSDGERFSDVLDALKESVYAIEALLQADE